jgi:hypothetical protein
MCAPISAIIGFSFLLTWIFVLYQPSPGPGVIQRLGWQSWDVITMPANTNSTQSDLGAGSSDPNVPEHVDWWNVTAPETKVDSSNLPLDVWAPLLPHDAGCTSDDAGVRELSLVDALPQCLKLLLRNALFSPPYREILVHPIPRLNKMR